MITVRTHYETLNGVLARLGATSERADTLGHRRIRIDGKVVFVGRADAVWDWLEQSGRIGLQNGREPELDAMEAALRFVCSLVLTSGSRRARRHYCNPYARAVANGVSAARSRSTTVGASSVVGRRTSSRAPTAAAGWSAEAVCLSSPPRWPILSVEP